MKHPTPSIFVWPFVAALAMACADPAELYGPVDAPAAEDEIAAPDPFAVESEKIRNGEVTTERPEVGSIGGCTATLIAPDLALTAAHCVGYRTRTNRGRYLTFRLDAPGGAHRVTVDRYRSFSSQLGARDVALLGLAEAVPERVATPVPIAERNPPQGGSVTVYGYGCTAIGRGSDGRKRKASFRFGDVSAHLCPGDSGGPVFDNGTGAIYGINSGYRLNQARTDIFGNVPTVYREVKQQADAWTRFGLPGEGERDPDAQPPSEDQRDPEGADLATCSATLDCRRTSCNLQGQSCLQGCLDRSEPAAVELWRDIYDCAVSAGCRSFSCTQQRCGAQLQACADDLGPQRQPEPDPEPQPEPDRQPEVDPQPEPAPDQPICGQDMRVFAKWTCTGSFAHRHRCVEGETPVWEACASGCWQPGSGMDAECRAESAPDGDLQPHRDLGPCDDVYRPYQDWACATDGATLLRCAEDRIQVHHCATGCVSVSGPDACR